ncbi:MAG: tetratricopeptide repeat protein [Chitinophagaceae bacterium]|nr:MAG: tetratricopeptide repeat protein [Chitinophagaceae bacterium]
MKKQVLVILSLVTAVRLTAQDAQADLRRGNELYRQKQYPAAEAAYEDAGKKDPANLASKFNKANAMHRQNKQSAAIRELDDLSFKATDDNLKSQTQYNKGVILSGLGKTEESIESYKSALRLDPTDNQARENLQKALKELEKKKQEPQPDKQEKQQSKQQQQQQPQPQPQMNQKEAEQRLKLLEQKEKEVQQRLQRDKSKQGSGTGKDW